MDFAAFIHMGGYALNVWGAYAIGLVAYGALLAMALRRLQILRKQESKK